MKTILIVDDDKKIAAALSRRLETNGYNVLTAADGFAALGIAVDNEPDLILMDIFMPAGMGLAVAARLRAMGCTVPILFMTASRKPGLWAAAQEVGGSGFIEKPYDPQKLIETIQRVLATPALAACL